MPPQNYIKNLCGPLKLTSKNGLSPVYFTVYSSMHPNFTNCIFQPFLNINSLVTFACYQCSTRNGLDAISCYPPVGTRVSCFERYLLKPNSAPLTLGLTGVRRAHFGNAQSNSLRFHTYATTNNVHPSFYSFKVLIFKV